MSVMPIVFVVLLVGIVVVDVVAKAVIPLPWPISQRFHRVQSIGALPATVVVSGVSLIADVVVAYIYIRIRNCETDGKYFLAFLLTAPALLVALWRWLGHVRLYESYDARSTLLRRPVLVPCGFGDLHRRRPCTGVGRQPTGDRALPRLTPPGHPTLRRPRRLIR